MQDMMTILHIYMSELSIYNSAYLVCIACYLAIPINQVKIDTLPNQANVLH